MSLSNTSFGCEAISAMLKDCRSVYFLGIGGVNMSSLARMTAASGMTASGYDRTETSITDALEAEGIRVYYTLDENHVKDVDALVYTVAIGEDNPEYLRALERGIPVISRADYLGYLMCSYRRRIGISGMHGKSTTTAMAARIFETAGTDPTVMSGAVLRETESTYRGGGKENFIFEACEYKDSFLDFYPTAAVVLNIDLDHLDYFSGIEHIRSSFVSFVSKVGSEGAAVLNFDNADVRLVAEKCGCRVVSFGIDSEDAEFRAVDIVFHGKTAGFDILRSGVFFTHVELKITGRHSVIDALAAAAVAAISGISPKDISAGLADFDGAHRRMEFKGKFCGADVYDDYAHHPAEIRSTLAGAEKMGYNRIFCVFQPHTYSRTATLYGDFLEALSSPSVQVVTSDIYAARETDTMGVSSEGLAHDIPGAVYFADDDGIVLYLRSHLKEGDCLIVMGAGDIYRIFDKMF